MRLAAAMQIGDRVTIRFPDGHEEKGTIAVRDDATVTVRLADACPTAFIVASRRLRPVEPAAWRLDL